MQEVTVRRELAAGPDAVAALVADTQAFMAGAGFDSVSVADGRITINNQVGLFDIELVVDVVERAGAVLAYEQVEGIFEDMTTWYGIDQTPSGTQITATTTFEAVDLPVLGQVIDATIVTRQRKKELNAQFDWLEDRLGA